MKIVRKAIIRINEIKVLRVHTSYIGIYINNVRVRREKWLLETTHRDKIVRKINFYLRKGWYQSIYMSVLVKFINPFALSGFFFKFITYMYQYIVPQSMKRFWFDCFDVLFIYFFLLIYYLFVLIENLDHMDMFKAS